MNPKARAQYTALDRTTTDRLASRRRSQAAPGSYLDWKRLGPDIDVPRQMVQFMAQRLMDVDVESRCGAGYDEKAPGTRLNSRNGFRERTWEPRAGTVELQIPKLRRGSYFPEFLEPRRTAEKALAAVIQEAYVHGVSTRSVDDLVTQVRHLPAKINPTLAAEGQSQQALGRSPGPISKNACSDNFCGAE